MKILSLLSKLWQGERPKPPTVSQVGVQARAIRHLIEHGWIDAATVWRMGTTDAHKMFSRMRKMGLIREANDPSGYELVVNPKTGSRIRRHRWTGKLPLSWLVEDMAPCPLAGQVIRRVK